MPIYEYEPTGASCEHCRPRFSKLEAMNAAPLTACPHCGHPVQRVFSTFGITQGSGHLLSDKNLAAKGFTKYVKTGSGYEKAAGSDGPDRIPSPK